MNLMTILDVSPLVQKGLKSVILFGVITNPSTKNSFGNSTNLKIANKLISKAQIINDFILSDNHELSFLEID